ncbi:MAG TPA: hypothetical protein VKY32_07205 [Flavobacterium sp.]|nr:hypothetical protein [Flavobacterium sp.]
MFWSGADFQEDQLNVVGGKFKDASIFYNSESEIEADDVKRSSIHSKKKMVKPE